MNICLRLPKRRYVYDPGKSRQSFPVALLWFSTSKSAQSGPLWPGSKVFEMRIDWSPVKGEMLEQLAIIVDRYALFYPKPVHPGCL